MNQESHQEPFEAPVNNIGAETEYTQRPFCNLLAVDNVNGIIFFKGKELNTVQWVNVKDIHTKNDRISTLSLPLDHELCFIRIVYRLCPYLILSDLCKILVYRSNVQRGVIEPISSLSLQEPVRWIRLNDNTDYEHLSPYVATLEPQQHVNGHIKIVSFESEEKISIHCSIPVSPYSDTMWVDSNRLIIISPSENKFVFVNPKEPTSLASTVFSNTLSAFTGITYFQLICKFSSTLFLGSLQSSLRTLVLFNCKDNLVSLFEDPTYSLDLSDPIPFYHSTVLPFIKAANINRSASDASTGATFISGNTSAPVISVSDNDDKLTVTILFSTASPEGSILVKKKRSNEVFVSYPPEDEFQATLPMNTENTGELDTFCVGFDSYFDNSSITLLILNTVGSIISYRFIYPPDFLIDKGALSLILRTNHQFEFRPVQLYSSLTTQQHNTQVSESEISTSPFNAADGIKKDTTPVITEIKEDTTDDDSIDISSITESLSLTPLSALLPTSPTITIPQSSSICTSKPTQFNFKTNLLPMITDQRPVSSTFPTKPILQSPLETLSPSLPPALSNPSLISSEAKHLPVSPQQQLVKLGLPSDSSLFKLLDPMAEELDRLLQYSKSTLNEVKLNPSVLPELTPPNQMVRDSIISINECSQKLKPLILLVADLQNLSALTLKELITKSSLFPLNQHSVDDFLEEKYQEYVQTLSKLSLKIRNLEKTLELLGKGHALSWQARISRIGDQAKSIELQLDDLETELQSKLQFEEKHKFSFGLSDEDCIIQHQSYQKGPSQPITLWDHLRAPVKRKGHLEKPPTSYTSNTTEKIDQIISNSDSITTDAKTPTLKPSLEAHKDPLMAENDSIPQPIVSSSPLPNTLKFEAPIIESPTSKTPSSSLAPSSFGTPSLAPPSFGASEFGGWPGFGGSSTMGGFATMPATVPSTGPVSLFSSFANATPQFGLSNTLPVSQSGATIPFTSPQMVSFSGFTPAPINSPSSIFSSQGETMEELAPFIPPTSTTSIIADRSTKASFTKFRE